MRRESFEDDFRRDAERDRAEQALREVVNNTNIKIDKELQSAINDDRMVMDQRGVIRKLDRNQGLARIRSSGQFTNLGIPLKRTRKKTKMDRTMSKCLKMANKKFRKANGQLRKGKTMRDVMRYAHRLCRKEK
jgi:arginine repressor